MDTGLNDWNAWFDRHGSALLLYARQIVPGSDADDVVQEAFVRFWRGRHSALDPIAHMYRCVKTCALDLRRATRRRVAREVNTNRSNTLSASTPLVELQRAERQRAMDAALSALPEDQRELFVLKTCTDLTFNQIAQILEIPANTAASRYRYACDALRVKLAREVSHE